MSKDRGDSYQWQDKNESLEMSWAKESNLCDNEKDWFVSSWENERLIGWPRIALIELVKINMFKAVKESMLLNRTEWPRNIHAVDYD